MSLQYVMVTCFTHGNGWGVGGGRVGGGGLEGGRVGGWRRVGWGVGGG